MQDKDDEIRACAFCGLKGRSRHRIFHSVARITDVRFGEYYLDRFGFELYVCDRCDREHRQSYWRYYGLIALSIAVALVPFFIRFLSDDEGVWFLGAVASVGLAILIALGPVRALRKRDPWKRLVARHPVVVKLLESGYRFDDDDDRTVGEGRDTTNLRRTRKRYFRSRKTRGGKYDDDPYKGKHVVQKPVEYTEHETYCWMGALQNFGSGGEVEPSVAAALKAMEKSEKGRPAPCSAKELVAQEAWHAFCQGIGYVLPTLLVYWLWKLLKG